MPSLLPSPCRIALLAAMLTLAPPLIAREHPPAVSILQPGGYDPADLDVSTLPAHGWLALVKRGDHWELVHAKVALTPEISSPDQPKALVFLHARQLVAGKVSTLAMKLPDGVDTPEQADDGKGKDRLELTFNRQRYRLSLPKQGTAFGRNLFLDDGHTRTVLDANSYTDSALIMWAGDLDHDGRLDLIIGADHENGQNADTCLYLSSAAGKQQLVKQVACQGFSG